MNTIAEIENFLDQKSIAIVGISRSGRGFGNIAFQELFAKGYHLYPVHPELEVVGSRKCYPNLGALPGKIDSLLLVVPPRETEKLVKEAAALGIGKIWMQQGSESERAIGECERNGIRVIHGQCILMFARKAKFFHKLHRWTRQLLGKLPK